MTLWTLYPVLMFFVGFANGLWLFRARTRQVMVERDLACAQRDLAEQDRDQAIRGQLLAFDAKSMRQIPAEAAVNDSVDRHPAGSKLPAVPGQRT